MAVTNAIQLMAATINDAGGVLGRNIEIVSQPVLSRAGVLDITAISKADAILSGKGNPLAVRLNSSNSLDGAVIGNYIANIAKARRIAFLSQNDAYGNGSQASN